ncbi:MAG: L,D-transpeptidase family protein [Nitrospirae bacterium]|nr:L,D-transpeptidase family protein [Nitrospirota bacterium]
MLLFLPCCLIFYCGSAPASFVQADRVVVIKSKHVLMLFQNGYVVKTYQVCLGRNPVGHKMREGDNRTPEGTYILDFRNPKSTFHLSLHISYPDREDSLRARQSGFSPGGGIMIHGFPDGFTMDDLGKQRDWTKGCIAVSNADIEEIWQLVPDGTPIEILP